MAPIPGTLVVNFTSNYAGQHRVCWRIGPSGPYDCSTIVNCAGGGAACQALIPVMVENDACDDVTFEGYIQAACELESSLNGRIAFSAVFTPNPACKSFNIKCNAVGVLSITITDPGESYDPGSPPAVAITGGGGSSATATAVVGDGGIKNETITNGGTGYFGGGSAIFFNVPAVNLVSAGAGALYDVTVTLGVITSVQLSAAPTSPGSSYAVLDTIEFNNADLGGSGSGVVITIDEVNTGEVQYITVTVPGSGYSSVPTVTIDPSPAFGGPPVDATAVANMENCVTFNTGDNCDATVTEDVDSVELQQNFNVCKLSAPTPPLGYIVTQQDCCFDCTSIQVSRPEVPGQAAVTFYYTDCVTRYFTKVEVDEGDGYDATLCIVVGSFFMVPSSGPMSVVSLGDCIT